MPTNSTFIQSAVPSLFSSGGTHLQAASHLLKPRPLACAGTAQVLVWYGDRLIAGTKRGYVSASLRANGDTVKICDLGADTPLLAVGTDGPAPVARHVPLSADTTLLVDDLAVIVDPTGAPSVSWKEPQRASEAAGRGRHRELLFHFEDALC